MSRMDKITEPGHPDNWPRILARKYKRMDDAIKNLIASMDEANMSFALPEFLEERLKMKGRFCPCCGQIVRKT